MKRTLIFFGASAFVTILFYTLTSSKGADGDCTDETLLMDSVACPQHVTTPMVPERYELFGEKMPLERLDVYESFDREIVSNTFGHTNTILAIKRSRKYFPIIEPILKENGIPEDFKYLAVAESVLSATVRSGKDAVGFWQFLEATGKENGLEINDEVDERCDVTKSTKAACKMLRKSYESLGSWALVAAAYNGGQARAHKNMSRQQQNYFYDILWTEETARYIFRIAAIKLIMSNPGVFGFDVKESDCYRMPNMRKITVDGTIEDIAQFALDNETTYKSIREYNPWLRQNKLTNIRKKTYEILIPDLTRR